MGTLLAFRRAQWQVRAAAVPGGTVRAIGPSPSSVVLWRRLWLFFQQLLGDFHGIVIGLLGGLFRLVDVGLGRLGGPLGGAFGLFGSFPGRLHRLVGIGLRLFPRLLGCLQQLFRAGGGELLAALQ